MSDPILTIAIPTYKNFKQLVDCLFTLNRFNEYPFKVVVVNNGPERDPDGTLFAEQLQSAVGFPVKVLQAEHNLGWAGGINRAFEQECDTPLFCMCNDDVVFIPQFGFFQALCKPLLEYDNVGAVGPSSNFVMGSQSIFDHRSHYMHETTLLIGFCMVVKSQLFAEIGGLDEGLPGGDDLDLSILIRQAGYRLIVNRTCFLFHIGSQTGAKVHGGYWNSQTQQDQTNNALIRKHGVRAWYDTLQSHVMPFRSEPVGETKDAEGEWLRQHLTLDMKVIDVGCGANKTWPEALGVDLRPRGEHGNAGGSKWVPAVTDMIADARSLPVPSGSHDAVLARHLLEHVIDPYEALEEWKRVLRPGGTLLLAVPNEERYRSMLIDSTHVHAYTPSSLRRVLEFAGFEIESLDTIEAALSIVVKARRPAASLEEVA